MFYKRVELLKNKEDMSYTQLIRRDFGYICKLMKDVDISGNHYIMECLVPCLISDGQQKIMAYEFYMRSGEEYAKNAFRRGGI